MAKKKTTVKKETAAARRKRFNKEARDALRSSGITKRILVKKHKRRNSDSVKGYTRKVKGKSIKVKEYKHKRKLVNVKGHSRDINVKRSTNWIGR